MLTSSELYAAGYEVAVRGERPDGALWQWRSYRDGFRHGSKDDAMPELGPGRQRRRRRPTRQQQLTWYPNDAPAATQQTVLFLTTGGNE